MCTYKYITIKHEWQEAHWIWLSLIIKTSLRWLSFPTSDWVAPLL